MKITLTKESKRAAIISYGPRISMASVNIRSVELKFIREYLINVLGRECADFVNKKTKKEADMEFYKDINEVDLNYYDEVYIYNSTFNVFGGVFMKEQLVTFEKLFDYNGDIYYFLGDPKMPCLDFGKFAKSRIKSEFGGIPADKGYYPMTSEFCDKWSEKVYPNIKIAFAGKDYNLYYNTYTTTLNSKKRKNSDALTLNPNYDWASFWLFEYFAVNEDLENKLKDYDHSNKIYDLVYFGNNRNTERNKLITKLYNNDLKKFCLGFDAGFKNCEYSDYIKHEDMFPFIGEKCLATVVVGDDLHNNNIRTPRFFEAMLLDTVAFIYTGFDKDKSYINNEFLRDFIYVSTAEEIIEKVNKVKEDIVLYNKIVKLEREEILNKFISWKK